MKGRALHLVILLVTLAVPPGVLLATIGLSVTRGNPVALWLLCVGLIAGDILLWRYATRERYLRAGWLLLKGLLFNAGWTLTVGLLIAASLVPASMSTGSDEMVAQRQEMALVEEQLRNIEQKLTSSGNEGTVTQLKAGRYQEFMKLLEMFETQLQNLQTEAVLTQYTSPLLKQAQHTRKAISAELERLQGQTPASDYKQTPDMAAYERLREQHMALQAQLTSRVFVAPTPVLPPLWRYLLCTLGFVMAGAGIIIADETFIRPLLRVFPFFKGEERKKRENAEAVFHRSKQLLQDEKEDEAFTASQELEPELLSPAQRQEAEFYHAYTIFQTHGAEATLPLLEKHHAQFPDFRPTIYLLGYVYLSTERYDKARPVWEQMHGQAPNYLETKYYYSCAVLAQARQLMKEAKVNEALPLFKIVRELGIHADAVPEGLHNARLMEAAGKLRLGDVREAEAIFAEVEKDGRADKTPEGVRLEALGKLGHVLVDIHEGRGDSARQSLDELLETFHKLTEVNRPPEYTPDKLQTLFTESQDAPFKSTSPAAENGEARDGEGKTEGEEKSTVAALHSNVQGREVLRDLYFLYGVAQVMVWLRISALQRPNPQDATMRDSVLVALRCALHFDPAFADALAVYGFVLYFYSNKPNVAASFLKQARNAGFEEEALITLLQHIEQLLQIRARTRTEILDRLHEYFTNEEIPRLLKEKLLEEEAIRNGYQEHHGDIQLDDIGERQPTIADLTARSSYLGEEINRIIKKWEQSGIEQQRLAHITEAMENLKKKNEEIAKVKGDIEEDENTVLRESGLFVLSPEF